VERSVEISLTGTTVLCAINSYHYKTNNNQNTINEKRWTTMENNNWRSFVRLQNTCNFAFLTCSANVQRNSLGWSYWVGFTALQFSGNSIAISSIAILCSVVAHPWPLCGPAHLGPFWVHSGSILGLFVCILGPFWILF
jgi:hypothetical protein